MRDHGTRSCYTAGCRREECREANRLYAAKRERLALYGRPTTDLVPAAPVRAHVARLQAAGVGWRRIAELAGIGTGPMKKLLWGHRSRGHGPSTRVRPATAAAILAVRADLSSPAAHAYIDATGTHRRLRALVSIGWSQRRLADALGLTRSNFGAMMTRTQVRGATARAVADLYEQLWNKTPAAANRWEETGISYARRYAAEHGWPPPMAWDDDTIDDPDATADVPTRMPVLPRLPSGDELLWLLTQGETIATLARRYGALELSVERAVYRARRDNRASALAVEVGG